MREIKFRAWDKTSKQMFYPHYIQWAINGAYRISAVGMRWTREKEYLPLGLRTSMKIKRIELMQFTGLKDKNGKEIYEGDIVQSIDWGQPKRAKAIVIFEGYEWRTVPKHRGSHKTSYELWSDIVGKEGGFVEVIGNIYENPELLK